MVRSQIDQMIRTRNFRARNGRIENGVLVKSQMVKAVSVERRKGECYQWKAHGQCARGDSCSFSHGKNRGQQAQSSSLAPKTQTQIDGRRPSTGTGPGEKVLLEGKVRKRANVRICTNLWCNCWHPPVCQNDISESGCKFGDNCLFRHTEADRQPSKKLKNSGVKGSVALLKESKPLGCVSQEVYATEEWQIGIQLDRRVLRGPRGTT